MGNLAISVQNLSKRYRIGAKVRKSDTLFDKLSDTLLAPIKNFKEIRSLSRFESIIENNVFYALKNLNFEVERGEVLGIIGHNGAGKSTLLKILSRITEPTEGEIKIYGRLSALLEVGTGFHPELTGRDNIYMNGTILGMTKKEINQKFDEIVAFSGNESFIDTPVKFYSSGMKVRLGFSVAAHLNPEILVVDEVLAVGDAEFQRKCIGKMQSAAESGRTVLFVSHDMSAIERLCHKVILLDKGEIIYRNTPIETTKKYILGLSSSSQEKGWPKDFGFIELKSLSINEESEVTLRIGESFTIRLAYKLKSQDALFSQIKLEFFDEKLDPIASISNTFSETTFQTLEKEEGVIIVKVSDLKLNSGRYTINLKVRKFKGEGFESIEKVLTLNILESQVEGFRRLPDKSFKSLVQSDWFID
jgi:lipopolysaccharide transport system ATP-binding protein